MNKLRPSFLAGAGAVVLGLTFLLPTSAYAGDGSAPAKNLVSHQTEVIPGTMTIDCSTFSEEDRQRAIRENLNLCGSLNTNDDGAVSTRGQTVGDCGVSSIYVEKWGSKLRISYGMHSTAGVIVTRSITATWGPAATGSNYDFGAVGTENYTNSIFSSNGTVSSGSKAGGTLRGSVAIAGWTFACWVSADDPVHKV